METNTPLVIRFKNLYTKLWQKTCLNCPENLQDIETESTRLNNLSRTISAQPNIQSVAWITLMAFSCMFTEI